LVEVAHSPSRSAAHSRRTLAVLIVLTLILIAPFANKAVHIDDMVFIACAEQIERDPLHPFDFELDTDGRLESVWRHRDPPLIPYYLAGLRALGVRSETGWHVGFLVFPAICVAAAWYLAGRFGMNPFIATWLLVATPAFLVNATTLMLDVPLLAFYLCALAAFVRGHANGRVGLIVAAGVSAGMASLTKYAGLSVLPLFAAYELLNSRSLRKTCLAASVACLLFGVWCVHNLLTHGELHLLRTSARTGADLTRFGWALLGDTLIGNLTQLTAATLLPIVLLCGMRGPRDGMLLCVALLGIVVAVRPRLVEMQYAVGQQVAVIVLAALGGFALLRVLWEFGRRATGRPGCDVIFLALWIMGILVSNVMFQYAAAKYTLMLVPPMIFMLPHLMPRAARRPVLMLPLSCVTAALALFVTNGDYTYAAAYRDAVPLIDEIRDQTEGRVWFRGHWGFQYYMQKEGYEIVHDSGPSPRVGDRVVIPLFTGEQRLPLDRGLRAKLWRAFEFPQGFGLATMNPAQRIGFYSHWWGFLPYAPSSTFWERFHVLEIAPE